MLQEIVNGNPSLSECLVNEVIKYAINNATSSLQNELKQNNIDIQSFNLNVDGYNAVDYLKSRINNEIDDSKLRELMENLKISVLTKIQRIQRMIDKCFPDNHVRKWLVLRNNCGVQKQKLNDSVDITFAKFNCIFQLAEKFIRRHFKPCNIISAISKSI